MYPAAGPVVARSHFVLFGTMGSLPVLYSKAVASVALTTPPSTSVHAKARVDRGRAGVGAAGSFAPPGSGALAWGCFLRPFLLMSRAASGQLPLLASGTGTGEPAAGVHGALSIAIGSRVTSLHS